LPFCNRTTRDFELPGRSEAFAMEVMAATSHPLATLTALDILRRGGNAVDAAVAAVALLGMIEPTQSGIGGDCFALLMRRGEGEVIALNGSGWAPAGASLDRYRSRAMTSIPVASADAVTVPGTVASWAKLVADHGTMTLAELLAPAMEAAQHGHPVTERVARDWARQVEKLRADPVAARIFLRDAKPPRPGDVHRQPSLAAALRAIAADGPAAFYQGWIARDMVDTLRAGAGCHIIEDFADYAPEYVTPVHVSYRGYDFGTGIVCPSSGVIFHNRGQGFVLEGGHPNAIAGRKRPLHTIIPAMLTRNGKAVMPFGVTGGQFQPFGQVQVLTNILDYGVEVQAAIDAPRIFAKDDTIKGDRIEVEGPVPADLVAGLTRLGHRVVHAENPLGTAQTIWIDWESGLLRGGADGRRDGAALGW
jgi:gamma-glutamyltranspeptidase